MADRWAVATGNWSNTATWNGGTLPGSGDDVFADGFTVTIDQNITVLSIRTTQRSGGTAGGVFAPSNGTTLNCNVICGTTSCITPGTGVTFTVNGNVTGSATNGVNAINIINGSCVCTINGNVTGGSVSSANGVINSAASVVNVNGTCTGGSNSSAHAVNTASASATTNIVGDLVGSTGRACNMTGGTVSITGNPTTNNSINIGGGSCSVSLTGNVTGTGTNGNIIIFSGTLVVTNNALIGGSVANRPALFISGGTARITANITAGSGSQSITHTSGVLYVVGDVQATTTQNAITSSGGASQLTVIGNVTGGTTGDGISSTLPAGSLIVVHGTVTGGSSAGGHGISHTGNADIRIFGSEVAGAGGAAVNNTGTGTKTTTAVGGGGSASSRIVNVRGGADQ